MPTAASSDPVRRPASRRVLADSVLEAVLARLMDGDLPPGSPLNIEALARELDVSPTPVREALARLEATGLLQRAALRGYSVAPPPSAKDMSDLMDARLVLEPVNALLACIRVDSDFLRRLDQAVQDFERAPRGGSYDGFREYWAADERFHGLIAEQSGNRSLLTAYRSLGGHAQRFRQFAGVGVTDAAIAVAEHKAILQAFHVQNPELARDEMVRHIERARARSLEEAQGSGPAAG